MRERSLLSAAASLLICGLLAGVVVAAAAFPMVAFTGLTAKAGSDSFENLPSELKIPQPRQNSYVYANDGKTLITTMYNENSKYVKLDEIAPIMQQAIVASEDTRFYQHHGVDLRGVFRALVANNSAGKVSQGASTLTMQYVRNVLKTDPNLSPEQRMQATEDNAGRKLREMRYAVALEKKLSKKDILERYLNISYFGHNAYGIYAASETYFSKPASQLTLDEASVLAGLVQSPDEYDPSNPTTGPKLAKDRQHHVLSAMANIMHYITPAVAKASEAKPIELHLSSTPGDCLGVSGDHNNWGFFCDYLKQWWDQQPAFGHTVQERENRLKEGGYKIVTSLDPNIQQSAYNNITQHVYGTNNKFIAPMAVVQPGTGRVLALAVNRNYSTDPNPDGQNNYPNTVNPLITGGGDIIGYQTGSTFKMFTMLAALSGQNLKGKPLPLDTGFNAPSQFISDYPVGGGDASCGGKYCVKNDNDSWMKGYRTMWDGFGRSVNTYFVWLETQVGPQYAVNMAKSLGITFAGDAKQSDPATDAWLANNADQWGAFTLGVSATTPLQLANAYATVAAEGKYCKPLPVLSITDASGKALPAAKPQCKQVLDPDVARGATDAARCPVADQGFYGRCNGATANMVHDIVGRPVAGKTGTSEHEATESFAGFTPQVAAASTAVDPTGISRGDQWVGGGIADNVDTAVAHVLHDASSGLPVQQFNKPSTTMAYGPSGQPHDPPPSSDKPSDRPSAGRGNGTPGLPGDGGNGHDPNPCVPPMICRNPRR